MIQGYLLIFISILLGIVCSVYLHRTLSKKQHSSEGYRDVRSDLNNLLFEKSVALDAINKINQNYTEKKIDIYEKDRLMIKYSNLLKNFDEHILKIQPIVEMQDLLAYRNQLYSIIFDSINRLDKKLDNFSKDLNYERQNSYNDNNKKKNKNENNAKEIESQPKNTNQKNINGNGLQVNEKANEDLQTKKDLDDENTDATEILRIPSKALHHYQDTANDKEIQNNDEDNNGKNNKDDKLNSEKEVFNDFSIDEINKIQKDVLKILQRLENNTT